MEVLETSKEEIMKNAMDEYLVLKALLNSLSVNLTDIDKIKE